MKFIVDDKPKYFIIGVTCNQFEKEEISLIRFLRISYVYDEIIEIMKKLVPGETSNADCGSDQQG